MAPDVQTQVPMVLWTAPAYRQAMGLDQTCIATRAAQVEVTQGEVTHDAVFHTVLGLADVETSLRQPALDLTEGCRD
jgi:lipid A ethanolaminephosphotransferase